MLNIRRSQDRLIFNMTFPYLGKTVFILRRGPAVDYILTKWHKRVYKSSMFLFIQINIYILFYAK